jgi:hypothetical protein
MKLQLGLVSNTRIILRGLMMRFRPLALYKLTIPFTILACFCFGPASYAVELPTTRFLEVAPGDESTRSTPFIAWFKDLAEDGYIEEEYVVYGNANVYTYTNEADQDAAVEIQTPGIPYATRMLIRRPARCSKREPKPRADCPRFNGTVYVEVLNATAGWDGDPIWQSTHEYMLREGAVWVGISTKPVTVDFLRDSWGNPPWPPRNATRYTDLAMPEFGQVWDMLSQIGSLLKSADSQFNPLADLDVRRQIMVGYSQSASYQVTYANSFHDDAKLDDGSHVYDGYYVSAGGSSAKHVTGPSDSTPENLPPGDNRNLMQVDAPVVRFQTQTEVVLFPSFPVRQSEDDYPNLRFYEMAGGSHVDAQLNAVGGQALVRDLGLPPSFCPAPVLPYNPIQIGFVQSALMASLERWIAKGDEPPPSRFMELTLSSGVTQLARDAVGNAVGGVRPPEIQAPRGTYVETNTGPGFCFLFGGFQPFDEDKLGSLYPKRSSYFRELNQAIARSRLEGFLLPEDAWTLRRRAMEESLSNR